MYSSRIITNLNSGLAEENKIAANTCTQFIGYAGLSSILTMYLVNKFQRRHLLIYGQLCMSTALFLAAFFMYYKNGIMSVVFLNMYYVFFQTSMAGVHWVYLPEILTDQ